MAAPNPRAMSMNGLIRELADRGRPVGLIDRLRGAEPDTTDRQQRFHRAVADIEHTAKTGDELGRHMAEARLDAVIEESRTARQAASNVSPAEPSAPSFDGGVRRSPVRRKEPLTLGALARQEWAAQQAIAERAREQRAALDRATGRT